MRPGAKSKRQARSPRRTDAPSGAPCWPARHRPAPPNSCSRTCSSAMKLSRAPETNALKGAVVAAGYRKQDPPPGQAGLFLPRQVPPCTREFGGNQETIAPPAQSRKGFAMTGRARLEQRLADCRRTRRTGAIPGFPPAFQRTVSARSPKITTMPAVVTKSSFAKPSHPCRCRAISPSVSQAISPPISEFGATCITKSRPTVNRGGAGIRKSRHGRDCLSNCNRATEGPRAIFRTRRVG